MNTDNSNGVKKIISSILIAAVVIGAGSFYAGMKYSQSASPVVAGQGQGRFAQGGNGGGMGGGGGRGRNNGGFSGGEIIAKDDKSITVKLRMPGGANADASGQNAQNTQGGSKIIFLSASTQVMKAVSGSPADLTIGQQITAMGTQNSDGSINADTVQIRPASPTGTPSSTNK